ncbi:hypothetical protein L5G32_18690 [Gordonia sp. HY002]|uniref:sigma-54-dependent Fis family transcriptional regulator n=1 Tax=Gordonia zhenghanii TaxID=2911516 RepID=UPI001EF0FE9C|nr:helix-turn-helix domain-containing protein [Gordonia zhenghanii]MCF8572289.1 hypothetical protein [Gordonia zhenghanii]MCF8606004.1 hypothetical protein [Gordonia zhenghanii]
MAADRPFTDPTADRSIPTGLDPHRCLDAPPLVDVNPNSRLLVAALPILDRVADALSGTNYALLLADREANVVDIRAGDRSVRNLVDGAGVVTGRTLAEELTGVNAVGSVLEVGGAVSVRGDEHFAVQLRRFSCHGHPITNPLTRRTAGILDISCDLDDDNPLVAPFLVAAVYDIEERLLAMATIRERDMLDAFEREVSRRHGAPVMAIARDIYLANPRATRLVHPTDHIALQAIADDPPTRAEQLTMHLDSGVSVTAHVIRVGAGVIITLDPLDQPFRTAASPVVHRRNTVSVTLICGEPGSGRTTTAGQHVGSGEVCWFTASDTLPMTSAEWACNLQRALAADGTVVIEDIHLLPPSLAHRLAGTLLTVERRGAVILTACPVDELTGEHARLIAAATDTVELIPLRFRRPDIPHLIGALLRQMNAPSSVCMSPEALDVLSRQRWHSNLSELADVLADILSRRSSGDISAGDIPDRYRTQTRRNLTPIEQAERDAIVDALEKTGGVKSAAAARVGVSRTTLYRAMRRYHLS